LADNLRKRIFAILFRESPVFTRQIKALVDDDQYQQLQAQLMVRPLVQEVFD
jgi:hypothetical protein